MAPLHGRLGEPHAYAHLRGHVETARRRDGLNSESPRKSRWKTGALAHFGAGKAAMAALMGVLRCFSSKQTLVAPTGAALGSESHTAFSMVF